MIKKTNIGASAALAAALLATTSTTTSALAQDTTLIYCGQLLDIPGRDPIDNATLVIQDGKIAEIRDGFDTPRAAGHPDATLIDLRDHFVMPGLFDCHTHITGQYSRDVRLRSVQETDADAAVKGTVFAEKTLMAGFTVIRNVGSSGDAAFALRDAIAAGAIPGPRILVAGESISATGGHSDSTLGYREGLLPEPTAMDGIGDGVPGVRKAVRAQVKRGADVIKLTATGGVLSNTAAGVEQQFFEDELEAIIETGHLLGRKVAAHAHGATGIKAALRAGVDSIEHGTYLDDECIELFNETGAYLVPTIHAGKFVADKAEIDGYFPPPVRLKAAAVGPQIQDATGRAYRGGVNIAFGTDVGVGEHGTNAMEFVYMVEAGIPEAHCLYTATVAAAELCDLSDLYGTLEPGKHADIIALTESPLDNIETMLDVPFVMKGGKVFKHESGN